MQYPVFLILVVSDSALQLDVCLDNISTRRWQRSPIRSPKYISGMFAESTELCSPTSDLYP